MDLKERVLITIDPETETYSVDYGMDGPINLGRVEAVLEAMLKEIRSGELLRAPGITVGHES